MKNLTLYLFIIFISLSGFVETNKFGYSKILRYRNEVLYLNGVGLKSRFGLDLYSAGLYLHEKNKNSDDIINCNCPTAIKIKIHTNYITTSYFRSSVDSWFRSILKDDLDRYKQDISKFKYSFGDDIEGGDEVILIYIPNHGMDIYKNGKFSTFIAGYDFKVALSRLWLDKNTPNIEMRNGLLGI